MLLELDSQWIQTCDAIGTLAQHARQLCTTYTVHYARRCFLSVANCLISWHNVFNFMHVTSRTAYACYSKLLYVYLVYISIVVFCFSPFCWGFLSWVSVVGPGRTWLGTIKMVCTSHWGKCVVLGPRWWGPQRIMWRRTAFPHGEWALPTQVLLLPALVHCDVWPLPW